VAPQIAAALLTGRGTVKTHLEHIYAKTGLPNRTELAASYLGRQGGNDWSGR
jgi:DNA-binding CsgD family transcriptional regulator